MSTMSGNGLYVDRARVNHRTTRGIMRLARRMMPVYVVDYDGDVPLRWIRWIAS